LFLGHLLLHRVAQSSCPSQQADIASKALQENIRKLKETHKTTVDSLARTDTHLNEVLSEISSPESGLQGAEKKFVYMQEL
jgi:GC-rich sequence DNA-binding factor